MDTQAATKIPRALLEMPAPRKKNITGTELDARGVAYNTY